MRLFGSCHCGAIHFSVESHQPYPFNRCYCSICRKTAGGGGYAINLGADNATLTVDGREHLSEYRPLMPDENSDSLVRDPGRRYFCSKCGSALWLWDSRWPDQIHPHASAIDNDLPIPPEHTHMMLGSKASWVKVNPEDNDQCFEEYPDESLSEWHARHGLTSSSDD